MTLFLSLLKNPSWDIVLIFMLVAAGFFWGLLQGKKKMTTMMLAAYILIAVFPYIPMDRLTMGRAPEEIFMYRVGAFFLLLVLLALFLIRSFRGAWKEDAVWWEIFLLSVFGAGFLAAVFLSLAPPEIIKDNALNLSPLVLKFFADPAFAKWWTILPIFGVLFL